MTTPEQPPLQQYTAIDERVYGQLRQEMEGTSHGGLFSARSLDEDPLGLFHLENASFPANEFSQERFEWLKDNILHPFLITKPSYDDLVDKLDDVLQSDMVLQHSSAANNGSLVLATNHISYSDIPVVEAAMTDVNLRHGDTQPTSRQYAIASRLISLFKMPLLKDGTQEGPVVEDGLLWLGGYLQTVPSSASGSRIKQAVGRDEVNAPVQVAYNQLLNAGTRFCIAVSGTQDKTSEDGKKLVMDTVSHGTTGMLTEPNAVRHAERVLTIPVFMDCNPFVGGFSGAVDATSSVLSPRFLYDEDDVTHMMQEVAIAGNFVRPSGVPLVEYRKPTMKDRTIGRIATPGIVYKD